MTAAQPFAPNPKRGASLGRAKSRGVGFRVEGFRVLGFGVSGFRVSRQYPIAPYDYKLITLAFPFVRM